MTVFTGSEDSTIDLLIAYQIINASQKELVEPLLPLIRKLELTALDYMGIRDLLRYGECHGDLPLALILMALFAALGEGSLCLNIDLPMLSGQRMADENTVSALFDDFLSHFASGAYERLITTDGTAYLPLILDTAGGRHLLYFQKYYVHEKRLKHRLGEMLNAPVSLSLSDTR